MNQPKQQVATSQPTSTKLPYRKPRVVAHGDVAKLTGFTGKLKVDGSRSPFGGLYNNS